MLHVQNLKKESKKIIERSRSMSKKVAHAAGGVLVKAGKAMGKLGSVGVKGISAVGKAVTKKK